jgi:hypothetical protein
LPIDPIGQYDQRMIGVEQLIEVSLEELKLIGDRGGAWLHGTKLQAFEGPSNVIWQILTPAASHSNREL